LGVTGFSLSVCPSSMFSFPDIFWINFEDIEMKLDMIVYNNALQIKFAFGHYWSIFDRVIGPWTYSFHENFWFSEILWINFADIKMKLGMIIYNNEVRINFEFCRYWSLFDRVMASELGHISEVKFAARVFLDPFRGKHLVLFFLFRYWNETWYDCLQ
jgi:hypothetical protein